MNHTVIIDGISYVPITEIEKREQLIDFYIEQAGTLRKKAVLLENSIREHKDTYCKERTTESSEHWDSLDEADKKLWSTLCTDIKSYLKIV